MPTIQQRNSELANILLPEFQGRNEPNFAASRIISLFQRWRGLRGLWFTPNVDESGDIFDLTGQGRTLTRQGAPFVTGAQLIAFQQYSGAAEYHDRASEAGLEITGTNTIYSAGTRGISMGGWFRFDVLPGADVGLISKWTEGAGTRGYILAVDPANRPYTSVSSNGTAFSTLTASTAITANDRWYFIAMSWRPSTSHLLWVGDSLGNFTAYSSLVGVSASIFVNAAIDFELMAHSAGANATDGACAIAFLSAMQNPDRQAWMTWNESLKMLPQS